MANGLDRLEKFFSKRKASAASSEASTAPSSAPTSPVQPTELSFPSPSFIRPKTSRMAAREEFRSKQPASKTSEDLAPARQVSTIGRSSRSAGSRRIRASRTRSNSLDSQEHNDLLSVFGGFEFPKPPSRAGEVKPSWSEYNLKPLPSVFGGQRSRPCSPLKLNVPALSTLDSPPSSDPEDSPLAQNHPKTKKMQLAPHRAPPTPETSPEFGPVSDWQIQEYSSVDIVDEELYNSIHRHFDGACVPSAAASSFAQSKSEPFATMDSLNSSFDLTNAESLQEPALDEFLGMCDEEVAEARCEDSPFLNSPYIDDNIVLTPELPETTLEPPSSGIAAFAAACEAARIAARYNFDMLYVASLWPDERKRSRSMNGRLLVAYGLHNSPSPFPISADSHAEVLQSFGWVDYCDDKAFAGEKSRVYACALDPSHYVETQSPAASGLVFAGYRKPTADGVLQDSEPAELASLYREVETMLGVFNDIQKTSRLRQAPAIPMDQCNGLSMLLAASA